MSKKKKKMDRFLGSSVCYAVMRRFRLPIGKHYSDWNTILKSLVLRDYQNHESSILLIFCKSL